MLGETGRQEVTPICGNGDFLAFGSPRITARELVAWMLAFAG